jgi:hypothetical protein
MKNAANVSRVVHRMDAARFDRHPHRKTFLIGVPAGARGNRPDGEGSVGAQ